METYLRFAIRRIGLAVAPKGENYLAAGADLAEFLVSDKFTCRSTRLMLAELVLGELRNPPGKPHMFPSHPKVMEAVTLYDVRISEGSNGEAAKHDVRQRLRVPRSTLGDYIKMVSGREEAVAEGRKSLGYPKKHFPFLARIVLN